ncbi:MAG TPA: exodeoxyribonuclease VII small subunit [Pirellulales bacterium]|nr:exodeoxyribonuclease VII small subunit [Pirellulales bacterium]
MPEANTSSPCPPSFEEALAQLEQIVHQLEDGQLGLEESLSRYEHGVGLIKHCYGVLGRVERQIELLAGIDEQGNPVTEPLADEATFDADSGASGSGRKRPAGGGKRSRRAPSPEPSEPNGSADDVDGPGSLF